MRSLPCVELPIRATGPAVTFVLSGVLFFTCIGLIHRVHRASLEASGVEDLSEKCDERSGPRLDRMEREAHSNALKMKKKSGESTG